MRSFPRLRAFLAFSLAFVSVLGLAVLGLFAHQKWEWPSAPVTATATAAPAAVAAAPAPAQAARPPLPGDYRHGWDLFLEHCVECHGEGRRGTGENRGRVLVSPADLRDPILLASRTDDQLARAISQGGVFVNRSKWMPGFASQLSEQDVMDLVALLRGDSISLQECFPEASHYIRVASREPGPPVLAAFQTGPLNGRRPQVVTPPEVPTGATEVGFLMFAELSLPKAGPTPVAFLADLAGRVTGIRVALPAPDNARAQHDLEATLIRRIPQIPQLAPVLDEGAERLAMVVRRSRTP